MRMSARAKEVLAVLLKLDLPEDVYFDIDTAMYDVHAQCQTQEQLRRFCQAFPGTFWAKAFDETLRWWEYTGKTPDGILVNIYACREAPPMCKAVEETYEVEESVPVKFETQLVTKTRIRYECPDDTAASQA